jgi:hypothetical protein
MCECLDVTLKRGCLPPYKFLFVVDPRSSSDLSRHCETSEAENKITKLFESEGYVPPYCPLQNYIYDMIFIDCNWVSTGWQWSVNLYKIRKETAKTEKDTQNNTKTIKNTECTKYRIKIQNKKTDIKSVLKMSSN